ncbi:ABC transporter permease [Lacticaseibacillus zhaodongensis]|uniref:ABC transporter permease n=1 Tax=Lacticaseibacillus zhaodongensis TaxID=2668065 RepID=UPI0012D2EB90|nr:ABC transporter permease [Lacticaseibacillus zhaodongensis]
MRKKVNTAFYVPYGLWLLLFVIAPMLLIVYQSFFNINHQFTLANYATYFQSGTYLTMTFNSVWYAFVITVVTLLISYPAAYILHYMKHKQLWLLLIILPTWINLLLKAYAFIGIFGRDGGLNNFLGWFGIAPKQLLFTDAAFIFVAAYIEIPFMILPIFNGIEELDEGLVNASRDLGASPWQTFIHVTLPLTMSGVKSGVQAVFIPSLSLFMITRLIGGNRVITLGTAIEEHFLTTMNWGMGSTIGVVLIVTMFVIMFLTGERNKRRVKGGKHHA